MLVGVYFCVFCVVLGLLWALGVFWAGFYRLCPWGFCAFCYGGRLLPHSKFQKFFHLNGEKVDKGRGGVVGYGWRVVEVQSASFRGLLQLGVVGLFCVRRPLIIVSVMEVRLE